MLWPRSCRCPDPAVRHQLVKCCVIPHPGWLKQEVDARGNTGTHGFILVPAAGPYIQQGCASALYYLASGVPVVGDTSEVRYGGKLPNLC